MPIPQANHHSFPEIRRDQAKTTSQHLVRLCKSPTDNSPRKIKNDSIIDHTIFLRILENEDDNTNPNMILWAQNIVQEFNKMAKHLQGYQWPTAFQYSGEFTSFFGEDKIQHGRQLLQDYCKLGMLYNNEDQA